jgi:hypothetical protein
MPGQRYLNGSNGTGFNAYAAGIKRYGGGRDFPTMGRVDKTGYAERDLMAKARRNAMLKRLQAGQAGNFASANFNRSI